MVTITESTRETPYTPVTPTTDFPCEFPIFGANAGEFPATDLEVVVNDQVRTDFIVIGDFVEGISTNAFVRMDVPITGDVIVRGKRTPRRTDQYANGAPLPIPAHNYSLNRLEAEMQEAHRDTNNLFTGLAAETAARIAGDIYLDNRINQEIIDRKAGDEAERLARTAADAKERGERIAGDQRLQAQIDGINDELDQFDSKVARAEAAAETAENAAETAQDLVEAATAGFIGFQDGMAYDWGYISDDTTYFDMNWGSIAA